MYTDFKVGLEVNFLGPATMIKEMLTIMKRQGKGHIVNVPYGTDKLYSDDVFAYCGAKTGLNRLLKGVQKGKWTYLNGIEAVNVIDLERVECNVFVTIVSSLFFCCNPEEVNTSVQW